jgi:hypothetical protein
MRTWALPAAAIVAVEYLFALLIGLRIGFRYQIPIVAYAIMALTIVVIVGAATIVARLFVFARLKEAHPTRRLIAEAPRFGSFAIGVLLVALQMGVLTWTKIMLPVATPFWADPLLANIDYAIFRIEPWRAAVALFGWAAPLIDKAYVTWAPVKFATLLVLVSLPETSMKKRALVSYFILMASVALGQYLLSSAGPVFYAQVGFGERFAALKVEPWVDRARAYLWESYLRGGGKVGAGISAMPSMHVAISLWVALVIRAYKPALAIVGYSYFAMILIGSVLLGWHYAVDGIVASFIALGAWRVAGRPVQRRGSPGKFKRLGSVSQ